MEGTSETIKKDSFHGDVRETVSLKLTVFVFKC